MIVVSDAAEVRAALESGRLVPHPAENLSDGSTARLRASMARFSGPEEHAARRAAVEAGVARVDVTRAGQTAGNLTRAHLDRPEVDAMALARSVPTEALVACLGLDGDPGRIVADVLAAVRVIGRSEAASTDSDAAVDRLLAVCGEHAVDAVPVLSMLYQNFDATAALLTTTLLARATGSPAAAAVPRTRRVASERVVISGRTVERGAEVVLEIGSAGLPFGAGRHQCPGQRLAEAIVAGIIQAIDQSGYVVGLESVVTDDDGRPTSMVIRA